MYMYILRISFHSVMSDFQKLIVYIFACQGSVFHFIAKLKDGERLKDCDVDFQSQQKRIVIVISNFADPFPQIRNPFSRIVIRSLHIHNSFSRVKLCISSERIATERTRCANRGNELQSVGTSCINQAQNCNLRERVVKIKGTNY